MEPIRLDVGCGIPEATREGYIGVDKYAENPDALKYDMWELPFPDGVVDEIYSGQALEHISKFQIIPTLQEWKRVLKIGGKVEINVPDLEWSCMWWLTHQTILWDMDIIYGKQTHEGEYHKTGFSQKILWDYFMSVGGFEVDSIEKAGGESTYRFIEGENGGISNEVNQGLLVLKATRVEV